MTDIAIQVEGLSKEYRIGGRRQSYSTFRETLSNAVTAPLRRAQSQTKPGTETFWALRDVSFEVKPGDVVGIIGRNGAGKSTLLKVLSRITEPTHGHAEIRGRIGSLLEVGTGFHPELTGRENIFLNGAILGMRRAEIEKQFDEIVAFAEVEKFIDTPVKRYSSGMYLRLAFAVAAHLEPEILLVDEVLAVGDVAFQKKCMGKMHDVAEHGRTVLFVSHNMGAVRALCNKGIFLRDGRIVHNGDVEKSIEAYYRAIGILDNSEDPASESNNREGFGRIQLDDGSTNTVNQAQGFQLSTTLRIEQEVSGFFLFCLIEDMQGRAIVHLREESQSLGLKHVGPGDYPLTVRFPPLWLLPGLYSAHFKVLFQGTSASARYLSDKFPLDVAGNSSVVDAVLFPRVEWEIEESSDAPDITSEPELATITPLS